MTDLNDPKSKPHVHWTISKGEPPEQPKPEKEEQEEQSPLSEEELSAVSEENAENLPEIPEEESQDSSESAGAAEIPEEKPRRKSLRERNIIRLLELGDEAVQMRDYRMARKYYNEAKDIFGSREAVIRLKDLDKTRLDYLRSLINSGQADTSRGRRNGRDGRRPPIRGQATFGPSKARTQAIPQRRR